MAQESRVFGMWWGGDSYSTGYVDSDVETFPSLDAAKDALCERYELGDWQAQTFHYVNKAREDVRTPAVSDNSEMWIWQADPTGVSDPYPDSIIRLSRDAEGDAIGVVSPA